MFLRVVLFTEPNTSYYSRLWTFINMFLMLLRRLVIAGNDTNIYIIISIVTIKNLYG